jgi:hypothetical protein
VTRKRRVPEYVPLSEQLERLHATTLVLVPAAGIAFETLPRALMARTSLNRETNSVQYEIPECDFDGMVRRHTSGAIEIAPNVLELRAA